MRETQSTLHKTLENLEKALAEDDLEKSEEELQKLFNKSEELLIIIQVLMKIRNELAHARLDLERAIKTNTGVDAAKKRVKWLQDRLEKVLFTARSYCHLYNKTLLASKTPKSGLKDQISEKLWNRLSEGQQQVLLQSEGMRLEVTSNTEDDNIHAMPIVKDITKMQMPHSESTEAMTADKSVDATEEPEHQVIVTDTAQLENDSTGLVKEKNVSQKRKQRKRSDGSKGGSNKSSSNNVMPLLPPTSPHDDQSDQESDTTAEPQSEPEDFDGRRSDSIASSVAIPVFEIGESDVKGCVPVVAVSKSDATPNDGEDSLLPTPIEGKKGRVESEDLTSVSKAGTAQQKDDDVNDDKVEEYWSSDHHKFEWSGYMQSLNPRSWHALGIGVPESFLSKEKPSFDPDLPWKEKPMKVNSVIDVHKIALDKLLVRLHKMYEAIGQATQTTIDPTLKDEKIETVMGKLELEVEGSSVMEKQQVTQPLVSKQVSPVTLPHIGSPADRLKSTMSVEKYPVIIHEPTAIRTARRNTKKLYPQHSSTWCDDVEESYRMPSIAKAKAKPNLHKRKSVVQPRYLPRKQESPKNERQLSELNLPKYKSIWVPSMLMKIVRVLKVFAPMDREQSLVLDHDGPKWSRIQYLLSEGGVLSSNPVIAAEAAKTIGQLKCREKCVIDTLTEVIKLQRDSKVCYEASKALILLGTWDPCAMRVIRQYIKKGNKAVVLELLSTMTKARDIAFVDKTTHEFKQLVNLLIFTIKTQSPELAFHAAVSLGRLCVVEPVSKTYLITRLPELSPCDKGEALYVLIKQMNCKEKLAVDALLEQLSTAHNWKLRMEAADLLIFIGTRDVFKVKSPDEVFDTLERLLWDHANKELRSKVSEAISSLDLRQRACQLVLRRLEDPGEEVRGRAVISLATLEMKGVKEMKALLDILELDSSVYVRIQVVRAFGLMEWNDPRILRSLREREKGEGTLATEARKTLAFLVRCPGKTTAVE